MLVADIAALLHGNGYATRASVSAVDRLNALLGTRYRLVPAWREVTLVDEHGAVVLTRPVNLSAINMSRVTRLTRCLYGERAPTAAGLRAAADEAAAMPASPTWLFCPAAGAGAVLLALIFGLAHLHSGGLIFAAGARGGLARRLLGGRGASLTTQIAAASLIGGLAGGLSVHLGWTSAARLVAVCPAMVLVPGPQVLNGCLDIARRRHDLGLARLADAALTILAIAGGLVAGMAAWGASLPVSASFLAVPLWVDVLGAGLVACCYPVYFSMPYRTIPWALLAGGLGHALHWIAVSRWGWGGPAASMATCALVSAILTPVSRRFRIPFAGAGFAAVVALVPGVYFFRATAGLLALPGMSGATASAELLAVAQDLTTASLTVLGMAIGLLAPYHLMSRGVGSGTDRPRP